MNRFKRLHFSKNSWKTIAIGISFILLGITFYPVFVDERERVSLYGLLPTKRVVSVYREINELDKSYTLCVKSSKDLDKLSTLLNKFEGKDIVNPYNSKLFNSLNFKYSPSMILLEKQEAQVKKYLQDSNFALIRYKKVWEGIPVYKTTIEYAYVRTQDLH